MNKLGPDFRSAHMKSGSTKCFPMYVQFSFTKIMYLFISADFYWVQDNPGTVEVHLYNPLPLELNITDFVSTYTLHKPCSVSYPSPASNTAYKAKEGKAK